jgi:hypothetical protein
LEFFEKDTIDRVENAPQKAMYKALNDLRANNRALWSNEKGAPMVRIENDNSSVFSCVRQKSCPKHGENTVIAIMNMSATPQNVTLKTNNLAGEYQCLCGKTITLDTTYVVELQPWKHMILTK